MATVACKVAKGFALPSSASRLLGVVTLKIGPQTKSMHSRTSGLMEPLEKPWPYKKVGFSNLHHLFDGTTKRFKDNSKMIVVEGPPALNKTKFAQELAEEFGMLYVPGFTMDNFYINPSGYDLRELDHVFTFIRNKSYDEKKFAQDPTGQDGGLDRMLYTKFIHSYMQYTEHLAHIFNTGQGVVSERSPHSDWVYFEAAYRQGWISKSTREHYYKMRKITMWELLRPNMIIYLDAPVPTVQEKIRARAQTTHPWEKNSPVYENTDYLSHLYEDLYKKQYLPEAGKHSYVLTYDWSEGGDTEVVVEDIERMEMDYHDKYDPQQKDWRLHTEDAFASKRHMYSGDGRYHLAGQFNDPFYSCDDLILTNEEAFEQDRVRSRLPGNEFITGFNSFLGDPEPFFNFSGNQRVGQWNATKYPIENLMDDPELAHGDRIRANKKALGDPDWWKAGWDTKH